MLLRSHLFQNTAAIHTGRLAGPCAHLGGKQSRNAVPCTGQINAEQAAMCHALSTVALLDTTLTDYVPTMQKPCTHRQSCQSNGPDSPGLAALCLVLAVVASGGVYLGLAHTGSHAACVLTMVALPEPGVYLAMTSARAAVRVAAMMAHPIAASTVISGHRTAACRWTGGAVPEISLLVTARALNLTLRRPVLPLQQC